MLFNKRNGEYKEGWNNAQTRILRTKLLYFIMGVKNGRKSCQSLCISILNHSCNSDGSGVAAKGLQMEKLFTVKWKKSLTKHYYRIIPPREFIFRGRTGQWTGEKKILMKSWTVEFKLLKPKTIKQQQFRTDHTEMPATVRDQSLIKDIHVWPKKKQQQQLHHGLTVHLLDPGLSRA